MTNLDEKAAPRPISGVDFNSLTSTPSAEDFFVLSRIDGATTVAQLCTISGLGRAKTLASIARLHSLGLIEIPGLSSLAAATSTPSEDDSLGPEILSRFHSSFEDFSFDPRILAEQVELDEDFKKEVLFIFSHLDELNYYELLGASPNSSRRDLRRNYFAMSKRYHPDRFFRKILGSYEKMADRIFQQITAAYQTVSHKSKKAEYDAGLQQRAAQALPTRSVSQSGHHSSPRDPNSPERRKEAAFKLLARRAAEAFDAGSVDEALQDYRKALSLKRDHTLAIDVARKLLSLPERFDDALAFARAAEKIQPGAPAALILIAEVYERKGNPSEALLAYKKALLAPSAPPDLKDRIARLKSSH